MQFRDKNLNPIAVGDIICAYTWNAVTFTVVSGSASSFVTFDNSVPSVSFDTSDPDDAGVYTVTVSVSFTEGNINTYYGSFTLNVDQVQPCSADSSTITIAPNPAQAN